MNYKLNHKKILITGLIGIVLIMIYLSVPLFSKKMELHIPLPIVITQNPQPKSIVEYVTQTGTTVAFNAVDLVARVEGYLEKIEFSDGSMVTKGQELFVIQPQPYQEQLKAAEATLAAQKAADSYNQSEYQRQQRMYKEKATSLNEVEKWRSKTQEIQAEINKATANVVNARITNGYTHVVAPFDGRIGRHLVDIGNLVGNGQATKLATVEQISPLYIYFNLNELDFLRLRTAALAKGMKARDLQQVPVYVSLQNNENFNHQAHLDFVNTGLNASTGTMELRALLANTDHAFIPGSFVQVKIAVSKTNNMLSVPDSAVLYDQIGAYVLSVDGNKKVVLKRVSLGGVNQGYRGIVNGIDAQDQIIIEGLQNATVGNLVEPQIAPSLNKGSQNP